MERFFLNPWAFLWAGLAGIVILFYLLKLRRNRVRVSSVLLWERVVRDIAANTPFQKLRRNLLLLVQLLVLLLLVTALARPYLKSQIRVGERVAVVVDTSYSMLAGRGGESRLREARRELYRLIDGLAGGQEMLVMAVSDRPHLLTGFTSRVRDLRRAASQLSDSLGGTPDLKPALELIDSLSQKVPTSVVLITDGGMPDVEGQFPHLSQVSQITVGKEEENLGIVSASVIYDPVAQSYATLARVGNFSPRQQEVGVELRINGELIESQYVELAPGEIGEVVFDQLTYQPEGITLDLLDAGDRFPLDDQVSLVMAPPYRPKVLAATDNPLMLAALRANPALKVESWGEPAPPANLPSYDLVVTDRELGPEWGETNYLFFGGASHPMLPGSRGKAVGPVGIVDEDRTHPLLRFLTFSNLRLASAYQVRPRPGTSVVVEATSGPLVLADQVRGYRVLYLAFPLEASDFPLRATFPVFVANAVRWISGHNRSSRLNLSVGERFDYPLPGLEGEVEVVYPSGRKREAQVREGLLSFPDTRELGVYRVLREGNKLVSFAVNLTNQRESELSLRAQVRITGQATGEARTVVGNRELFRWLVLAALLLVIGEWWLFHRRVWT